MKDNDDEIKSMIFCCTEKLTTRTLLAWWVRGYSIYDGKVSFEDRTCVAHMAELLGLAPTQADWNLLIP